MNDIDLTEQRTNGNAELRVTQVDVGLPGAVRRLLAGHRSARGDPPHAGQSFRARIIRWEFVNLIEPDPLRRVKLAHYAARSSPQLHPADLADIMEELSPAERQSIIDSLDEETAAEAIAELDKRLQTQMVEKLDPEKAADIIEEMSPDEAADLIQPPLAGNLARKFWTKCPAAKPRSEELLSFDHDTAGGMMNTEFVVVGEDATRGEVVDYIRFHEVALDQLDNIVLINRDAGSAGTVRLARLLLAGSRPAHVRAGVRAAAFVYPDAQG